MTIPENPATPPNQGWPAPAPAQYAPPPQQPAPQYAPPTQQPPAQYSPPTQQPPAQYSPPAQQPPAQYSPPAQQPTVEQYPSAAPYTPMAPAVAQYSPAAQYGALWPKPKRPIKTIVTIVLLSLGLAAAAVFIVLYVLELSEANARIREQNEQINQQQELIDKKETFGAAMENLLDTAGQLEGTLVGGIVQTESYERTADRAWTHRWDLDLLDNDIENVAEASDELEALIAAAGVEASTNGTGSVYEAVTDQLGGGYVTSLIEDADSYCGGDVLACVDSADPYKVHFDAADNNVAYTNDFIRTGVAYHEFAHVLQMTNPEATDSALIIFGGNSETMADCFALTFLEGWKLDHRVWVSSYMYYDVSIGYGYTCNEPQRQTVRDWYAELGYKNEPISQ